MAGPPLPRKKGGSDQGGRDGHDLQARACEGSESGVIVRVKGRPGDAADHDASLCERVLAAIGTLGEALPKEPPEKFGLERCGDGRYFSTEQIAQLQECEMRAVIADPQAERRHPQKASEEHRGGAAAYHARHPQCERQGAATKAR